ncbi:SDR family oxidoreductase [Dyella caseinilytica]|uniref:SDR family oxidoreductase n=1 Tax=Dyella caseinilytica TaxID=1849581 RepID=A0ABX7GV11_9GAMM|nr:SDR family oxidoreductase [Dyella caseinilytica]QRN53851.1 SDR family oxidoreductase [Dyella caseinilytica]GFZ89623.1 3-beta hydroxysteroid dehydrogenase [Dyella caseinilytica]
MRVFVTGATGWVGLAVVKDLLAAGHQVLGLARSEERAQALAAAGASVQLGSLADLATLSRCAAETDGVIHTAFNHDFSKLAESSEEERRAIETIGGALEGSDRPFIVTSGVALLAPGRVTTENEPARAPIPSFPRSPEIDIAKLVARGLRVAAVRLAPTVHGLGDHGFVPRVIGFAREKGVSAYVGDGQNRWPAVHRFDAARVFRLALEHGAEGGPFHAITEEGVPFKQIAEVIGRRLNLPVVALSPEEAAGHFGWFGTFVGIDCPSSSERTRSSLSWQPEHPTLLADLDQPGYFA